MLCTLHTNDAPSAVTRLINIGIEPYLVAATVRGVLGQRLVRKICPHCKKAYDPEPIIREAVETYAGPVEQLYQGEGCARCCGTGFAGRIGIFELIVLWYGPVAVVLGTVLVIWMRLPSGRRTRDWVRLHVPIIRTMYTHVYVPAPAGPWPRCWRPASTCWT